MGLYSNRAMLAAVPKLHAAISRMHAKGDTVGAAKARLALDIALGKPKAHWFATESMDGTPPPAASDPMAAGAAHNATLDQANKKLVQAYLAAKAKGDRDTCAKLEPYL